MNPIITAHHPFSSVAIIEVFEPQMRDQSTITFFAKIDQCCIVLELKNDNLWKTKGLRGNYGSRIVTFIQEKIEQHYSKIPRNNTISS